MNDEFREIALHVHSHHIPIPPSGFKNPKTAFLEATWEKDIRSQCVKVNFYPEPKPRTYETDFIVLIHVIKTK